MAGTRPAMTEREQPRSPQLSLRSPCPDARGTPPVMAVEPRSCSASSRILTNPAPDVHGGTPRNVNRHPNEILLHPEHFGDRRSLPDDEPGTPAVRPRQERMGVEALFSRIVTDLETVRAAYERAGLLAESGPG